MDTETKLIRRLEKEVIKLHDKLDAMSEELYATRQKRDEIYESNQALRSQLQKINEIHEAKIAKLNAAYAKQLSEVRAQRDKYRSQAKTLRKSRPEAVARMEQERIQKLVAPRSSASNDTSIANGPRTVWRFPVGAQN